MSVTSIISIVIFHYIETIDEVGQTNDINVQHLIKPTSQYLNSKLIHT